MRFGDVLLLTLCHPLLRFSALFLWEYLLTVGDEVELIWRRTLGPATLIFFVNRAIPFLSVINAVAGVANLNVAAGPSFYSAFTDLWSQS